MVGNVVVAVLGEVIGCFEAAVGELVRLVIGGWWLGGLGEMREVFWDKQLENEVMLRARPRSVRSLRAARLMGLMGRLGL